MSVQMLVIQYTIFSAMFEYLNLGAMFNLVGEIDHPRSQI